LLDAAARRLIDPPLTGAARRLTRYGLSADAVTVAGFGVGLLAMLATALGHTGIGLLLLLLNRLADGLDGAVARATRITDRGGFLDIVLDFILYSGFVFAFAVLDPARNALPAAFLIFSFVGTGCSFLAYAVMAAKRGLTSEVRGRKSLYYLGGLTEGTETIACFVLVCLWPAAFPFIAWTFGSLCWITTLVRINIGVRSLTASVPGDHPDALQDHSP
jgi:phosphatidylglycerophosphate synthase